MNYKTSTKKIAVEYLQKKKKPLTAQQLIAYLQQHRESINKTTVYRLLKQLIEEGVVSEVHLGEKATYYELADLPHHHHVICSNCNTIEDVDLEMSVCEKVREVAKKTGFLIENHSLEFFGKCQKCQ